MRILFRLAFRNLWRHPLKTLLIFLIISTASLILFLASSLLGSTLTGIKKTVTSQLTGDLMIGAQNDEGYGIFGNELPIMSELEYIPPISNFNGLLELLEKHKNKIIWTPITSTPGYLQCNGYSDKIILFGIDAATYFKCLEGIKILRGNPIEIMQEGIFINSYLANEIKKKRGSPLEIGEEITITVARNNTFTIRKLYLRGIYSYSSPLDPMNRIVLADPTVVRDLLGYSQSQILEEPVEYLSLMDVFSESSDIENAIPQTTNTKINLESLKPEFPSKENNLTSTTGFANAWSFVLIKDRNHDGVAEIQKSIQKYIENTKEPIRIIPWNLAAGNSVTILFALQTFFSIGYSFLLFAVFLVITNSFILAITERTSEIGLMRALGTGRFQVGSLLLIETLLLIGSASMVGIIVGSLLIKVFLSGTISLSNPFIISLLGSPYLSVTITVPSIVYHTVLFLGLGIVVWFFPTRIALTIQPRSAINEHE